MAISKYYDVVYRTKSGRTMVSTRVEATSKNDAMAKLKKQMRASSSFDKPIMAILK